LFAKGLLIFRSKLHPKNKKTTFGKKVKMYKRPGKFYLNGGRAMKMMQKSKNKTKTSIQNVCSFG
jgi:hypothetical protein